MNRGVRSRVWCCARCVIRSLCDQHVGYLSWIGLADAGYGYAVQWLSTGILEGLFSQHVLMGSYGALEGGIADVTTGGRRGLGGGAEGQVERCAAMNSLRETGVLRSKTKSKPTVVGGTSPR